MFHHSGIVCAGVDICLHRQNLNAVQAFQFLLGIGELLDIASGDDKVCTLFGVGGGNAVADGTASAVTEDSSAGTGDDGGLVG